MSNDFWDNFEDIEQARVETKAEKFKMKNSGEKARIHFILVNPKTQQVALKRVEMFSYNDEVKNSWARFIAPAKDSKAYQVAVKHCGEPQVVYVTPILVYSTNDKGRVINGEEYELSNLTLPKSRFFDIKNLQGEYNLSQHDVVVMCEDSKYQKLKFTISPECGVLNGSITAKNNKGEIVKTEIDINREQALKEAVKMAEDMETAVANRWSESQIINFFEGDDAKADDFDDMDSTHSNPKQATMPELEDDELDF